MAKQIRAPLQERAENVRKQLGRPICLCALGSSEDYGARLYLHKETYAAQKIGIETHIFDIDNPDCYYSFKIQPTDEHCLLTTFDVYSVSKGIEVLRAISQPTSIVKAIITCNTKSEESEYLDFATFNLKIKWKDSTIYFPFDTEDLYEIYQNQRFSKVRFTGLSMEYMDSLSYLIESLTGFSRGEIKRAIKMVDKDR